MRGLTRRLVFCQRLTCASPVTTTTVLESIRSVSTRSSKEEMVINNASWSDNNFYRRLGFKEEVRDVNRIKEHYRILAKHYHPDNSTSPRDAKEAFQNVNEAYEYIMATAKNGESGTTADAEGSGLGFRFADHERRVHQMRFLGDGVPLFMVMTLVFIYLVARHNKNRLKTRYLSHLIFIFFMIQLFPRLLAAAILYACHTTYLVNLTQFKEQAATSLILERREDEFYIRVDGLEDEVRERVVLQVTATALTNGKSSDEEDLVKAGASHAERSTTLTFGVGATNISLPAPSKGISGSMMYRVKGVDEKRGFVVLDRTLHMES